jgi:hypothetical protein
VSFQLSRSFLCLFLFILVLLINSDNSSDMRNVGTNPASGSKPLLVVVEFVYSGYVCLVWSLVLCG